MQLQSSAEALKKRGDEEGVNKMLLTDPEFRQAISLATDRAAYNQQCTTASLPGFGLFNSMHYYDVPNGGVFRNSDEAKKVLCDVYAVNVDEYASLDDAVDAITGYNLAKAKELVEIAVAKAIADGNYTEGETIKFTFGTSVINESEQRKFDFLTNTLKTMVEGTSISGKLETELKDFGDAWANDFRAGAYDVCTGGWTGAAWDPGYFLLAYLSPDYMYSQAWDTSAEQMTFTMVGVGENGEDITETMSLMEWYDCLNGNKGCKYNWSSNALDESQRLQLIAALEKAVLSAYYTVPISNSFSASLLSRKIDYITYEYNTFMGYGGMRYMTYNYDDAQCRNQDADHGKDGEHTEQGILGSEELVVFFFRVGKLDGSIRISFLNYGFYLFTTGFPSSFLIFNQDTGISLKSELDAQLERCRTDRHGGRSDVPVLDHTNHSVLFIISIKLFAYCLVPSQCLDGRFVQYHVRLGRRRGNHFTFQQGKTIEFHIRCTF